MIKLMVLGVSILFSNFLYAGIEPQHVAKVISKVCSSQAAELKGSGLAFQHHGKVFVLTSEHVVLASNDEGFCHFVSFGQERFEAHILSLNWWKGVALLEVTGDVGGMQLPEFSEILSDHAKSEPLQVGDQVSMIGYPNENTSVFLDKNASVSTTEGKRSLIPGIETTYEVKGIVEWGMSGGPMIADQILWGVISHQYLQKVEGGPSYIEIFGKETYTLANHLIIIPFASIVPWLVDSLELKEPVLVAGGVRKDPHAQLAGLDVIYIRNAKLTFFNQGSSKIRGFGGGDGTGTGGRRATQNIPVSPYSGSLVIEFDDSQKDLVVEDLPNEISKWAGNLQDRILRRKKGEIRRIIVDKKPKEFYSLAGFFHQLQQDGAFANADWQIEGLPDPSLNSLAEEALTLVAGFDERASRGELGENRTQKDYNEVREFLFELGNVFELMKNSGQIVHSVEELQALKRNDRIWNIFIALDFDKAVKLRVKLETTITTAMNQQL